MDYSDLAQHIKMELFEADTAGEYWPKICKLHDAFAGSVFLGDAQPDGRHNCLGCNFAHYTWGLLRTTEAWGVYVKSVKDTPPVQLEDFYPVSNLFHWLNTSVDAFTELCNILEVSDNRRQRLFPVFSRIRVWANFFKHPKAMILTHHAAYVLSDEAHDGEVLRESDIKKYFANNKNDGTLLNRLTNKVDVVVVLPDLREIISQFKEANDKVISLILDNEVFREEIGEKSTFEGYYTDEEPDA